MWQRSTRAKLLPLFMVRNKLQALVYDIEKRYRKARFGGTLRASFSGTFLHRIGHIVNQCFELASEGGLESEPAGWLYPMQKVVKCCLMSSDVSCHIRDKL